jgi:hypothetical protein
MQTLSQLHQDDFEFVEEEKSHTKRLLVGVLCAVLLTGAVFGGYLFLRKRHERQVAAAEAAAIEAAKHPKPKVEVLVDEPTMNGKTSTLGGTIHNISGEQLHNLAVELQLRKRAGSGVETRTINPESADLEPDGKTHYKFDVAVSDYISATFLRVVSISGDTRAAIPFKALPGTPRPAMELPQPKQMTVNKPASKDEEFINTPNNPGRLK